MMADDSELLRRYTASRDDTAFAELVRRYLNLVYFAALRQVGGDAHRAEDVSQTVFTLLARKAASLTRHQTLAGWLHTTTRFTASEALRAERRRITREREAHFMHELSTDPALHADWEQLRPIIDEALNDLGAADREVVLLRFFANLPFAELGAKLNLSENTARMRVERALEKLHALLAKRGVTSTSGALAAVLANQAAATAPVGLAASVTGAALSGAAAVGTSIATMATLLSSMSATKVMVGVVAALATGALVYQTSRARIASDEVGIRRHNHDALVARLADSEKNVASAEKELADRQVAHARVPTTKTVVTAPTELSPEAQAALARNAKYDEAIARLVRTDPERRKLTVAVAKANALVEYRPFFLSAGLTPAQCEQFADFRGRLAERNGERRASGTPASADDSLREFVTRFGRNAVDRFAQFEQTQGARDFIKDISARAYFLDEPFSPAQTEQLIGIVDAARPAGKAVASTKVTRAALGRRMDWEKVLAEAAPVVSAAQLQALRGIAAQARLDAMLAAAKNEAAVPQP